MQLLLAIVQAEDADVLVDRLIKKSIRVTRLNSLGSFLARGNATIFMGVEDDQVEPVFEILRATCKSARAFLNVLPQIEAPHASLLSLQNEDADPVSGGLLAAGYRVTSLTPWAVSSGAATSPCSSASRQRRWMTP